MTLSLLRQDSLLTPLDVLSEAVYTNTKLDHILGDAGGEGEKEIQNEEYKRTAIPTGILEPEIAAIPVANPQAKSHAPWRLKQVLAGAHLGWVRSLAVDSVTNEWFVLGLADGLMKVWDLASGEVKAAIPGHIMGVRALAISNRYSYLFSGSEDKTVRCWDLERTNSPLGCQIRNYHGHVGGVYAMALHPELDLLFTAGRDLAIRVWDIRTRTQVMVLTGHRSDVTGLVAQLGDPQVISASMDSTLRLWDIRNQKTQVTLTHHAKSVRLLVLHPHELTMASGDSTGSINQWVLPQGQLLHSFGEKAEGANIINTMAVNPGTNELFAGLSDGRMHFYDYESGKLKQAAKSVPAPGSDVSTLYTSVFDMLGTRLITGESDKSIKIWANN